MQIQSDLLPNLDKLQRDDSKLLTRDSDALRPHFGGAFHNGGEGQAGLAAASFGDIPTMADYLIGGFWAYSGYQGTSPRHWASGTISVNITGLTASEQADATAALGVWHDAANLNFVFTSGAANITFNHNGSLKAFTTETVSGQFITSATVDISSNWYPGGAGSYMFQTYIHEIGHALGLGHQGPYNGSATYGVDNIFTNDTWQWSVMSYFD